MSKSVSFNETILYSMLRDDAQATGYLSQCLTDEDPKVFLLALRDLVNARNIKMAELSRRTGIQRGKLYRILSLEGNPEWKTIWRILQTLGLQLAVQSKDHASA